MSDKTSQPAKPAAAPTPAPVPAAGTTLPVRRHPGHRGADVRDTVAEMAAKAHEISLEAGSKMAAAMKDVINAGAGLAAFSIESARDLVQFMVRRSQMTQDEADKLMASAEDASSKRKGGNKKSAPASKAATKPKKAASKPAKKPASKKPAAKK